jgi:hypothetical protein
MSVDDQAAPAGAGVLSAEQPVAAPPIDHSLEGVLVQWRKDQEQEAKEPEGQKPEGDAEPDSEPGQEPEPTAGEADEPDGEPSEPEDTDKQDFIPGNALTRMQDGSVRPVGELKKAWGELQELKNGQGDLTAARQQIDQERSTLQQRAQELDQLIAQMRQSGIPDPASDELWETDPIAASQQDRRHNLARQRQEQLAAEQKRKSDGERAAYAAEQGRKLLEAAPEFNDPAKAQAFGKTFWAAVSAMGLQPHEVDVATLDHRVVLGATKLYEKAAKWDQLEASKAKAAKKAEGAAPVQAPGRRLNPGENRDSQLEALHKRARQTGRLEDVAAYHRALEAG